MEKSFVISKKIIAPLSYNVKHNIYINGII